jgi:hypothetical protein
MVTPIHGWEPWPPGIKQADQVFNDFQASVDLKLGIRALSRTTDAQPGSPSEGDCYIMTASASGAAWSSYSEHDLAFYISGAWTAFAPTGALPAYVVDDAQFIAWHGTDWQVLIFDNTKYPGSNLQTGTAYELVLSDAGKLVEMNNGAANTLTIPANASVAFPVNTRIDVHQQGVGQTTIAITTDTLRGDPKITGQYKAVSLWKRATAEWVVWGGTT